MQGIKGNVYFLLLQSFADEQFWSKIKTVFINCTTQVCRVTQAHQLAIARNLKKAMKKAGFYHFLLLKSEE